MLEKTAIIFIKTSIKDSGKDKSYSNYALKCNLCMCFFSYFKSF